MRPTHRNSLPLLLACLVLPALAAAADARDRPRARDLGIPFAGTPGPLNAITNVAGVEVGLRTLISGDGALRVGEGPIRTGVTAILPRGKQSPDPVFAAWYALNGTGEMTGTAWVEESGFLRGPIMITNTHSVGAVHEAVIDWQYHSKQYLPFLRRLFVALPVIAETFDGVLNDVTAGVAAREEVAAVNLLPAGQINELFAAVTQTTEEAILNSMVAAQTMTGINGNTVYALPHHRLQAILKKYNRLQTPGVR